MAKNKMTVSEAFEAGKKETREKMQKVAAVGREAVQSFPAQCGTAVATGAGLGLLDRTGLGLAIGERTLPASLIAGAVGAFTPMRKSAQGRAVVLSALAVGSARLADAEAARMGW